MGPFKGKRDDVWALMSFYMGLGLIIPAGLAVGYALGRLLDRWLHTGPFMAVGMAILGVVGGFIELIRIVGRGDNTER